MIARPGGPDMQGRALSLAIAVSALVAGCGRSDPTRAELARVSSQSIDVVWDVAREALDCTTKDARVVGLCEEATSRPPTLYLSRPEHRDAVRALVRQKFRTALRLSPADALDPALDKVLESIDYAATGEIEALGVGDVPPPAVRGEGERRDARAMLGDSIGTSARSAGTLGCRLVSDTTNNVFLLSNWHVLVPTDETKPDDAVPIYHPSPRDGDGRRIGQLVGFVPVMRGAWNKFDAAIARTSPTDVATSAPGPWRPSPTCQGAARSDRVAKQGRTTRYRTGRVECANTRICVKYGNSGSRGFAGQILIVGEERRFCEKGDSGALVVHESTKRPAALLFAAKERVVLSNVPGVRTLDDACVASPIDPILEAFEVSIDDRDD
jgi:hypothetical protein